MAIKIETKGASDVVKEQEVSVTNYKGDTSVELLKKEIEELKNALKSISKTAQVNQTSTETTADVAKAVAEALKYKNDSEKYGQEGMNYLSDEEVDFDDFLEKGVPFFVHASGYIIVDDLRMGRMVSTPFRRPIVFTQYQTHKYGSGKEMKTEHLARYISHSKKEVEWLRKSSFYGWKIFDDMKIARNAHAKLAYHINKNLVSARQMDKSEFIKSAIANGIPIAADLESMRLQYAQVMAEKDVKREEEGLMLKAKEAFFKDNIKHENSAIANAI